VAAGRQLAYARAPVGVALVAVVAGLAGPLVAVAADVRLAIGLARLAGAVVRPVVALLDLGVDEAVTAHRELAREGAGPGVAVGPARVALLGEARLDQAVAARRQLAGVGAAVVVVAVLAVVARLARVD